MARNVGSIEVSVEADTGKLKAQLVKDGRAAGSAAKKAIERELRNVEAEVGLNTTKARAELRQFRQAIDRVDGEIDIGFDTEGMLEELTRVQSEINAVKGDIELSLDKTSVQAVKAELKGIEEGLAETLDFQLRVDPKYKAQFDAQIAYYENRRLELTARLELDDAALRAKLAALQEEERDLQFGLELAPKARAILEAQLKRIEVEDRTIEMTAILNEKRALASLEKLEAQKVSIGITADTARATATYESWAARIEAQKVAARIDGDWTDFNLSLRELQAKMAIEKFEVDVEADTLGAIATLEKFKAQIDANDAQVPVDADLSKIRAAMVTFRAFQEANDIEVPISADIDSLDMMLARAEAKAAASGGKAGSGYGKGFGAAIGKILPGAIESWLPLVGIAIGPVVQALEGAVGGAVQVVSSAFSALGGAAGATAPIMAGLGATMAAVGIGSMGMGKAVKASAEAFTEMEDTGTVSEATLKKVDKAMRQLTPAARAVAEEVAKMLPQFRGIQSVVASHLFRGMAEEMRGLSQETIPDIGVALSAAADTANRFGKQMIDVVKGIDFSGTFKAVQPALESLGRAAANVARTIEPFLKAAAPAARELASFIEDASESFLGMVRAGAQSGAITKFLMEGVSSLKDWARLVVAVGDALATLFQAGKAGGDGLVRSLTTIVEKWDAWMESTAGQTALQDFFKTSNQLLSDMMPLIKGLADGIANIVSPAAGAGFKMLTTNLGDVLRVMGDLISVFNSLNITSTVVALFGEFARALEPIVPKLQALADALGGSLVAALAAAGPAIRILATAIGVLADFLTPLAPVIGAVAVAFGAWKVLTSIVAAVKAVELAIKGLGMAMTGLTSGNLIMLGLAAAVGVAFAAYQHFTAGSREMAARTQEVTAALDSQINALLETATQSTAASLGVKALSEALADAGGDGDKLTKALGTLGKTTGDSLQVLNDVGKNGEQALARLAKSAGLAGQDVNILAEAVNNTNDQGEGLRNMIANVAYEMTDMSYSASKAYADGLMPVAEAMEEIQDQAEKTNLNKITKEWLASSAASSELNQSLLAQAEAMTGVSRNAEDVSGLYTQYTTLLGQNAAEANASAEANSHLEGALQGIPLTLADVAQEAGMSAQALMEFESAAGGVADKIGAIEGPIDGTVGALRDVAAATKEGAAAAEEMRAAFDSLVSPFVSQEAAWSGYQAAVDDLTASLEENGQTMDTTTEAGRANTDAALAGVEGIAAWGEAALAAGTDAQFVQETMTNMRKELADRLAPAFGDNAAAAEEWINKLNLTPESIDVMVNTPGLLEAMSNIEAYDLDLNGIDDEKQTHIGTPGLDEVKAALQGYGVDITNIPDTVLTQWIAENLQPSIDQANALKSVGQELDGQVVGPTVVVDDQATGPLWGVLDTFGQADAMTGGPTVTAEGAPAATTDLQGVGTAADEVDGKKATVSAEVMNNMIVMIQLAAIQTQMETLSGMSASLSISQTGAQAAASQIKDLDKAVDSLKPKSISIGQTGAQAATSAVKALDAAIDALKAKTVAIAQTGAQAATSAVQSLDRAIDALRSKTVTIAQVGSAASTTAVNNLDSAIDALKGKTVSVVANVSGLGTVQSLDRAIDGLQSKTVTVTTRNVTVNSTVNSMAGRLVSSPMVSHLGERGYAEAVIPLELPLNRIDPSVRHLAEMLRTDGHGTSTAVASGPSRVINNYMTITPASADPVAVSHQIVNRAAVLASR